MSLLNSFIQRIQHALETPFTNLKADLSGPIFTESDPDNIQDAIEASGEKGQLALDTPRYTILLQNNGTVSNNSFIGYDSLIPGDSSPVIIPIKSELIEYTFSNSKFSDFTLEFRKNTLTGTSFFSDTRTNTQFYSENSLSETFNAGDEIYIKYIDNGTNASDAVILLVLKALP